MKKAVVRELGREGELRFAVVDAPRRPLKDLYHHLLRGRWSVLLLLSFVTYAVTNLVFAGLYWLEDDGIEGMHSFADALWFSVQTFSTIGYGALTPTSLWANTLVLVESFAGLLGTAMMAAVLFAKLSRPSARVVFSDYLVVQNRDGVPTLQLRIANERNNQILNAELQVAALVEERSLEGEYMRRFRKLALERERSPLFAMSWTGIHRLDEDSPLFGLTADNVTKRLVFVLVTFTGTDDTFVQTVHTRKVFMPSSICFGVRFADMIEHAEGQTRMHYQRLNELEPERSSPDAAA